MTFIKYIKPRKICKSPEHNPPGMILLKPGTHIWKCESCGEEQVLEIPEVTC